MTTVEKKINGKTYKIEDNLLQDIKEADDGRGLFSSTYIQVCLDTKTNEIFGMFNEGGGWSRFYEDGIITLFNASYAWWTMEDFVNEIYMSLYVMED